jgi:TonB family protein
MFLEILAAVAAAASPSDAAPPTSVAPVTVKGAAPGVQPTVAATVNVASDDTVIGQFVSVWPEAAYRAGINGRVVLSCKIDVHGLAEYCRVASETPRGKGFGSAALELRPTLKLKPAMGPDGPVDATMSIAIDFKHPDTQVDFRGDGREGGSELRSNGRTDMSVLGNPLQRHWVTMLDHPIWVQAAGFDDVARAYPAKADGAEGYAVAHCEVERSGALDGCQPIKEAPEKLGFGQAAVSLAAKFRVSPDMAKSPGRTELWVDVPIRFTPPGASAERAVAAPTWVASFDPARAPKLFPPEAAAQGLTTGRGVARCVVASDGALTDCAPETADPDGLGFSEAAVKLASTMKMNPWSADGRPVDGAVFRVAIRLNLKQRN